MLSGTSECRVQFRLLGAPEVSGLPEGTVFPSKGLQLIALLATSPDKHWSRREAASLLWDEGDEASSLTNLRQVLTRINKCLPKGGSPVAADISSVFLNREAAAVDLLLTAAYFRSGKLDALRSGIELFRGDLLAGMTNLSEPFQDWLTVQRAALRESCFDACAKALKELTHYGRARQEDIRFIESRLLALEPEREASYRTLIDVYGRIGDFDEADRLFGRLKTMLAREHRTQPAADTAALVKRIAAARPRFEIESYSSGNAKSAPRVAFLSPVVPDDGLATPLLRALIEDAANELTRYRSFSVLAPHSSWQLHHDSGLPADNLTLRADFTISGFVKPAAKGRTLALRLVECASKEIVWAAEFCVEVQDLCESSWRLARRIAASIASGLEKHMLDRQRAERDADAFFHYLRGRDLQTDCDLPKVRRARREFGRAIELDPRFAQAHARIAETLFVEWILLGGNDGGLLANARLQADRALALNPNVSVGHWVSGAVALYQRDFDAVEESFRDAEVLAPNCADLLLEYGDALSHLGDHAQGWEKFSRAIDLNPLPPDRYWWFGASIAFGREDFTTAVSLCGKLKSEEVALGLRTASYAMAGQIDEARRWASRVKEVLPGMSAMDFARLSPDRNEADQAKYVEGLRLAGVK